MDINKTKDNRLESKVLPTKCPSCATTLTVSRLTCPSCQTGVEGQFPLSLLARLDSEEQQFVVHLIRTSGSLKDLAKIYHVSYPTVRNRLDALIDKLSRLEQASEKRGS